ncbi:exopolysaccharide Pel transporter PelG [Caloranaerobacter ferrireducens]|uniref:exopolysaccharide Pel transporter PelG n=1 Tax=Caloranaerobacter ferrireducens TaxID=1323370 RepID=UPI00084CF4C5|nr:exopolysaccharide Pel transporter PelG [Caloranaerobacter ferrireducens]
MAGIGFVLKKLFKEEMYLKRTKAYIYSALVSAGPWIAAVITVNILLFLTDYYFDDIAQRDLFMGTIVYSFVFSQIITAPWQIIITRYISDKLYIKDYGYIRASFKGISKIIACLSFMIAFVYYYNKDLPVYYKYMSLSLFVLISLIWILMVYLGAVKNYLIISKAFIYGGCISVILTIVSIYYPIPFKEYSIASNILLSYLTGIMFTYLILMYSFLTTFFYGNNFEFDFISYISKLPSLFYIGLFYTLGLWIDDIMMWYSPLGVDIYETYKYAPLYDSAVFLAYLTVIPTMILFMVSIETEFYDKYKKYYGLAAKDGTYEQIEIARQEMERSINRQLIYTMETQTIITLTIIVLSSKIFAFLGVPLIVRDIFRISVLGSLCNVFVLLIILILLYFEMRKQALFVSLMFLLSNAAFTYYFIPKGVKFYGFGYFLGSFITLIAAIIILIYVVRRITYYTFAMQPLFKAKEKGIFIWLADILNKKGSF